MILSLLLSRALWALALGPTDVHPQNVSSCLNPIGQRGECIGIRECAPILELLHVKPLLPATREFLLQSRCGFDGIDPKVCCVRLWNNENAASTTRAPERSEDSETSDANLEYDFSSNMLLPTVCGSDVKKFYHKNDIAFDEFPWVALLEYDTLLGGKTIRCGGALINNRYVLTAAHCVLSHRLNLRQLKLVSVRLAEYNLLSSPDCIEDEDSTFCSNDYISVDIAEQIVHEEYNQYSPHQRNDIALLRLASAVQMNKDVQPICLPSTASLAETLYVAGWGRTEADYASLVKRKLVVPLFDTRACEKVYYEKERIGLGRGQFCAGGELHEDFCSGDSGGPLMALRKGKDGRETWTCVGILSMGPKECGTRGYPGVYTRVIDFIPWILGKIKS